MEQRIADAALYRGTVTAITEQEDGKVVTLTQAEGTDFGAAALSFLFDEDTQFSFEEKELTNGTYLGVYYGLAPGQPLDSRQIYAAIAANRYFEEEMVNFNGTLLSFHESDTDGTLEMQQLGEENIVLFHYSPEHTQFYLNTEELEVGDVLNIFHRGAYTMSIPPQGFALEVRPYRAPEYSQ